METNTNARDAFVEHLIDNFDQDHSRASLLAALGDSIKSRLLYKIALEFEATGLVVRTVKKKRAVWTVKDKDESNAIALAELFPVAENE